MLPIGIIALGLVQGSLAGLNSLGLVLLWRTTRIVNLAQPALGLVGGVLVGLLVASAGWNFWWAVPIGLTVGALLGLAAEKIVLARLAEAPRAVLMVATVGLAQILGALQSALPFAFRGPLPTYTVNLGIRLELFPIVLLGPHLLALISLPLALAGMYFFLHRSRVGLAACALGQDAERARSLGVPAGVVRATVWAVAGVIASISGILAIPVLGFSLGGGLSSTVLLLALAPAVFAGLRSLWGAAAAALALGVAYQAALWWTSRAGMAELLLAGSILIAIALQRRRFGRIEAAARASSWQSAATSRPLGWEIGRNARVRGAGWILSATALLIAALLPAILDPGKDVFYAASAALALGALAVSAAWLFAGEVVLGQWGLAGLGAAIAAMTPVNWALRAAIAGVAIAALGGLMGLVSRRQSGLSFAVLGLAAAAAAPVAILAVGQDTVHTDPAVVGAVGGCVVVLAAVALIRLRRSMIGLRMVAARDDPARGPWLGANPARFRLLGLSIAGGLAGVAGALYLAAVPAGIAPGAFDADRSLFLLTIAVIGGLGSPVGAMLGAGALQAAQLILPGAWSAFVSGAGLLFVVIFMPAGIGRFVQWTRDRGIRLLIASAEAPVGSGDR